MGNREFSSTAKNGANTVSCVRKYSNVINNQNAYHAQLQSVVDLKQQKDKHESQSVSLFIKED